MQCLQENSQFVIGGYLIVAQGFDLEKCIYISWSRWTIQSGSFRVSSSGSCTGIQLWLIPVLCLLCAFVLYLLHWEVWMRLEGSMYFFLFCLNEKVWYCLPFGQGEPVWGDASGERGNSSKEEALQRDLACLTTSCLGMLFFICSHSFWECLGYLVFLSVQIKINLCCQGSVTTQQIDELSSYFASGG